MSEENDSATKKSLEIKKLVIREAVEQILQDHKEVFERLAKVEAEELKAKTEGDGSNEGT